MSEAIATQTNEIVLQFKGALDKVQTENPKPEDMRAFRQVLDHYPQMWRAMGDLAHKAQGKIIDSMLMGFSTKASLERGIKELERELRRPTDGPLEELVIQQVILCWLRLNETEMYHIQAHSGERIQHIQSDYWDRKLTAAQTRYLRACEALARVRRLNRSPIHVRIAASEQPPVKVIEHA